MRKKVTREIEVGICDFCGDESEHLTPCAICKKEMCNKDGGTAHEAFSIEELYRFSDGSRGHLYICKICAARKISDLAVFTVQEFIDGMMGKEPVLKSEPTEATG